MTLDAWQALEERLRGLGIRPQDLSEHFVRSGGHGGQNVNKVSSCVVLTHRPTGITIRCEEERSQTQNRFLARKRLAEKLEALEAARIREKRYTAEKARRQKRKRNKTSKERTLEFKRRRSEVKKSRQSRWGD